MPSWTWKLVSVRRQEVKSQMVVRGRLRILSLAILTAILLPCSHPRASGQSSEAHSTLFGFTPFPYDYSLEALETVRRVTVPNSSLYAIHLDNGIPWKEMLADDPLPPQIASEWANIVKRIGAKQKVYVAIAPLDMDRKSLSPATIGNGKLPLPEQLKSASLDDPAVCRAYLAYVRFAVIRFHPQYLNIGIEAGEIMSRDFSRWPKFVQLYRFVYTHLKSEFPVMQIGISFGLGELRSAREAAGAKQILDSCDYVGLSFYPYASAFDEKFGAPPYSGRAPWKEPLDWIRKYTNKPIAICETGYTTSNIDLPQYGLKLTGSAAEQAEYVDYLFKTARRDRYLFVVWYLAIDYDKLYDKLPGGSDVMKLWKNIGLMDGETHPKPAWDVWVRGVKGTRQQ